MLFVDEVCWLDDFVGSLSIMSIARPELSYPCVYMAKWRANTDLRGRLCDHIVSRVLYIFNV